MTGLYSWRFPLLALCVVIFIMVGVRSADGFDWSTVDLQADEIPEAVIGLAESGSAVTNIKSKQVDVDGVKVFVQSAEPLSDEASGKTVLLLHGAAFTSQTWVDKVPTILTLAAMGHDVIAVDLPGYGKSRSGRVSDNGEFLAELIQTLTKNKVVIVTPSMSGGFIVPMLGNEENRDLLQGWVPVAPVSTGSGASFFSEVQVPTMIVYGENDRGLGLSSKKNLLKLPNHTEPQVLPGASHPAYLDQPDLWHKLLYNFINKL